MLNKKFIVIIAAAIMVYLGINAFAQPSEDTTAPIITLNGDAIMTINVGTNFVDPGATAQDDVDGNLTSEIVVTGDVDEDTLGTYQLRYNVSDNAGNAAEEVVRTVNVINPDPNAPIITLLGANPYIIEVDGTYVEPGARAEDDVDGEMILTDENITGEVDTSRLGTYLLYYDITDSNGNKALTVTRVVRVVDTAAPVITLNGASEVRIEVNGTYNELGATATDNYNQNLTVVIDDSELNLNALGTYKIYYNATDLSGNAAETVERTVIVQDTTAPVITLNEESEVKIEINGIYDELGASVIDNYDTNLTVVIDDSELNLNALGTYKIYYNATDSSGNAAETVERTVIVQDTTAPQNLTFAPIKHETLEGRKDFYNLNYTTLTGYDAGDGEYCSTNTPYRIRYVREYTDGYSHNNLTEVDLSRIGKYRLDYRLCDSHNNCATTYKFVHVVDNTTPTIVLDPSFVTRYEEGMAKPDFSDAILEYYDNIEQPLTIDIIENIDMNTPGVYPVTIRVTETESTTWDGSPRALLWDEATINIEVVEATPQAIKFVPKRHETLNGRRDFYDISSTTVTAYDEYEERNIEGNSPYNISYVREYIDINTPYAETNLTEIDLSRIGKYKLDYRLCDISNHCVTGYKNIYIKDVEAPTIVLDPSFVTRYEEGMAKPDFSDAILEYYDNIEQPLTIDIIENIDMNTPGVYPVTIRVTETEDTNWDGSPRELLSTDITIDIEIVDTTPPVVILDGNSTIYIKANMDEFIEPGQGSTAVDNATDTSNLVFRKLIEYVDPITGKFIRQDYTDHVDNTKVGRYKIWYYYTDENGNTGHAIRNVYVVHTPMEITTNIPTFTMNVPALFEIGTIANSDVGEMVRAHFVIPEGAVIEYKETPTGPWKPLVDVFGPSIGFPLGDITTTLRGTLTKEVTEPVTVQFKKLDGEVLGEINIDVNVEYVPMEITTNIPTFTMNVPALFKIGTIANSDVGEMVRAHFVIPEGAVIEYKETPTGPWKPLVDVFGPSIGFPLGDITTTLRGTLTKEVTEPVTVQFKKLDGEVLGEINIDVNVEYVPMEITTNIPTFTMNVPALFEIGTIANSDVGEMVRAHFVIPEGAVIEYKETPTGPWKPLVDVFGPSIGFPLGDITTTLRGTLTKEVTEPVTVQFKKLDGEVLGEINIDVNVEYVPMEITTNIPTFTMNVPALFEIGTIANSDVGEMVRAHFVIPEGAVIEYKETPTGPWKPLVDVFGPSIFEIGTIANSDVGEMVRAHFVIPEGAVIEYKETPTGPWKPLVDVFGPSIGFPLGDITTTLRGTFSNIGTYTSIVEFRTVEGNILLGSKELTAIVTE